MAEPFGLTYVTRVTGSTANPESYAAVNVGADVTGGDIRYTVVEVGWLGDRTIVSATIGGVAATIIGQAVSTTAGFARSALLIADTSGLGTSLTIVITYSVTGTNFNTSIGVNRLVNPVSATPYASIFPNANASGVLTLSINVPAGGAALGTVFIHNNQATTVAWSGLSEDFDVDIGSSDIHSGAHGTSTGSPLAITATSSDTTVQGMAGAAASWEPGGGGGGDHEGDGEIILAGVSLAGSATEEIAGAAAIGLMGLSIAAAGQQRLSGAAAISLNAPVVTAAGDSVLTVTGTAVIALDGVAVAGSGLMQPSGVGALSLAPAIVSGAMTQTLTGSAALTLAAAALSGSGIMQPEGNGALSLFAPTISASGLERIAGAGALALDAITLAATGQLSGFAGGAIVLSPASLAGSGLLTTEGTGAITLDHARLAALSTGLALGSGAMTFEQVVLAAAAEERIAGTASLALDPARIAADAIMLPDGAGGIVLAPPVLSGSGLASTDVHTASGALTLFAPGIAASGVGRLAGTGTIALDAAVLAALAEERIGGTGAVVLAPATVAGGGLVLIDADGAITLFGFSLVGEDGFSGFAGSASLLLDGIAISALAEHRIAGIGHLTLAEMIIAAVATSGGDFAILPVPRQTVTNRKGRISAVGNVDRISVAGNRRGRLSVTTKGL